MKVERRIRRDRVKAALVEDGIEMMAEVGRNKAAEFLLVAGISFRIIGRVLCEQGRRRSPH